MLPADSERRPRRHPHLHSHLYCWTGTSASPGSGLGRRLISSRPRDLMTLGIPGTNNAGAPGDPSLYYGYPGFIFPLTGGAGDHGSTAIKCSSGQCPTRQPVPVPRPPIRDRREPELEQGKHAFRGGIEWNHSQIITSSRRAAHSSSRVARSSSMATLLLTMSQEPLPRRGSTPGPTSCSVCRVGPAKPERTFNPNALRWSQWAWYRARPLPATSQLTLTLGLRWEYYPFGYSDNGKGLRYLNLNTGNVLIGGYGNVPKNDGIDVGHGLFLPRVGIAYRITPSTVIRAGYGMSADPNNWRYFRNAYPAVLLDTNTAANTADFIPAASLTGLERYRAGRRKLHSPDRHRAAAASRSQQRCHPASHQRQHDDDPESLQAWLCQLLQPHGRAGVEGLLYSMPATSARMPFVRWSI